ncbi:MAG: ATP-binding cassette domain-containing protein [Chitinophagales bacterium]|nr:ATP-binding cassette domain-containing protein [Chitinophagales bacterium]
MKIEVENISKRFGRQAIIKQFSYTFLPNKKYVITGANGSGKSTLLKMISGFLSFESGDIRYTKENEPISRENINTYISFAAPYIFIPEDLTILEAIAFQKKFKAFSKSDAEIIAELNLVPNKKITELSSGMKQRLHLGLAFFTNTPVLLLDEPTSFFDKEWKLKFQDWVMEQQDKRMIILCSNDEEEYVQFPQRLRIT